VAGLAAVNDVILVFLEFDADRLHQPMAGGSPVTGDLFVKMLAPQTVRAMIGITRAGNLSPADITNEIFLLADKMLTLRFNFQFSLNFQ